MLASCIQRELAAVIEKWRGRIDARMAAIYKKVTRHARESLRKAQNVYQIIVSIYILLQRMIISHNREKIITLYPNKFKIKL